MEVTVKAPASSANLGPCFDCAGIAFPLYNFVKVKKAADGDVKVIIDEKNDVRTFVVDEKNIIFQAFKRFHEKTKTENTGYEVRVETHIPIARGLGSSASVISGALIAANELNGNPLSKQDLIDIAASIEGHPDNTTPAFTGGFVVASIEDDGHVLYEKIDWCKDWKISVCIPDYKLLTELARSVLPEKVAFKDAVYNIQKSAQLITAITNHNADIMRSALNDKIHQPYREKLVPGMSEIISELKKENNVLGCVLSGAGPTLAVITEGDNIDNVKTIVEKIWHDLDIKYEIMTFVPEENGAAIV
ncbi:MAG: homoserine kinase [Candidatus Gastranaerophilales bacterium]|nr:homoserine kinase [Candidatus Gastranaerophilales bacterium]